MSTIKISQLANLPSISANTSNTLFVGVDLPSDTTGKFTATTLAQQLYANNVLVVGNYHTVYPNAVGTFVLSSNNYVQNIYDESIGALDNDNILLDGDNFLVNFYGGLLDDLKSAKSIKDNQLSFPS